MSGLNPLAQTQVPSAASARSATWRAALRRVPVPVWIVALAGLLWLAWLPSTPGYDTTFALAWAQDTWAGRDLDLGARGTPTPHPLTFALALIAAPFGVAGQTALLVLSWLAFAGLAWAVFRLGQVLGGTAVGVLATAIVLASARLGAYASNATGDIGAAALVLGAAVLEARRAHRGWPVLALLTLAGLLRPEAWLLGGAYWLWLWPARDWHARIGLAALAATAPVVWMVTDLALTGELLHSASSTAGLADEYRIPNSLDEAPFELVAGIAKLAGAWLAVPLLIGACAALAFDRRRIVGLPLAILGLTAIAFLALGAVGQPLLMRYLVVGAAAAAVLGAHGALGWRRHPDAAVRRRWRAAGIVVLAALAVAAIPQAFKWLDVRAETRVRARLVGELQELARNSQGRRILARCSPVGTLGAVVPFVRWAGDRPAAAVRALPGAQTLEAPPAVLEPRRPPDAERLGRTIPLPTGFPPLVANGDWLLTRGPTCTP